MQAMTAISSDAVPRDVAPKSFSILGRGLDGVVAQTQGRTTIHVESVRDVERTVDFLGSVGLGFTVVSDGDLADVPDGVVVDVSMLRVGGAGDQVNERSRATSGLMSVILDGGQVNESSHRYLEPDQVVAQIMSSAAIAVGSGA
jgi:hypothetical protein